MWSELTAIYAGNAALFAGCAAVLGLLVGSFLNVVIYRLPVMLERRWRAEAAQLLPAAEVADADHAATIPAATAQPFNLLTPRSACPQCRTPIKAGHNVPVLSWLWLRGRCAACGAKISLRYPLVEFATALASAAIAWHFGFGPSAGCALLVTWVLIALAGIDIDHQLLPDDLTLLLLWAGLAAAALLGPAAGGVLPVSPRESILGAAAGYLSLWLVFHAFRAVTGKEGMGYGDFKLFAALGAWLGWQLLPLILVLAAAAGAALGVGLIVFRGRDRAAPIPFGPYLAVAGWLAMLYGRSMISAYLHVSGLGR
ncbi:MAG TPA: prepilin peptidase [Steroidobacteraceae bacterium]|nr:prepilin peptidase [Steroidobacteraceae bacterium]